MAAVVMNILSLEISMGASLLLQINLYKHIVHLANTKDNNVCDSLGDDI